MANSLYAFTGRVPNGEQSRSHSPLWRAPGEPEPKGVASDRFLTPEVQAGEQRAIQLPPSASRSDHEQERLRLQVIEILQLTLSGCDRERVAERADLSMRQIGAWTSPSSGKNISLANTVQIVRATKRPDLLAWACEAAGYHLATTEDQQLAEVGRLYLEAERPGAAAGVGGGGMSRWNQCVIDGTLGANDEAFTFCPIEGDIDGEFTVVTGMNYIGAAAPDGMRVVALVHEDGQAAADEFYAAHKTAIDRLLGRC